MNFLQDLLMVLFLILACYGEESDKEKQVKESEQLDNMKTGEDKVQKNQNATEKPVIKICGYSKCGKGFREMYLETNTRYSGENNEEIRKKLEDARSCVCDFMENVNPKRDSNEIVTMDPVFMEVDGLKISKTLDSEKNQDGDEITIKKINITN